MCSLAMKALSDANISHDLLLKPTKLGKLIPRLLKQGYSHCVMIGEEEIKNKKWLLKSFHKDHQQEFDSLQSLLDSGLDQNE